MAREDTAQILVSATCDTLLIINLSSYQLSTAETSVLQRGLTFSPACSLDKFLTTKDLFFFCRKLIFKLLYSQRTLPAEIAETDRQLFFELMELLAENEGNSSPNKFPLKRKSRAMPSLSLFPTVQVFFNTVANEIHSLQTNNIGDRNLTYAEKQAIKALQDNSEFIIKEADKGGNIVLWPIEMYLEEANRNGYPVIVYHKLPSDPTLVFKNKLDRLLGGAKTYGIIDQKEFDFMTVGKPIIPTLYLLPKVHKNIDRPPGRPIVSGIGGLCEKACTYIDYFLQPLVHQWPSFLQDTTSTINKLENLLVPDGALLVTCDVEALYTNINHEHGVAATTYFLTKQNDDNGMHLSFLIDLLDFVLRHNYFTFDGNFYRQVSGTVMGARCAPSYANLFLG